MEVKATNSISSALQMNSQKVIDNQKELQNQMQYKEDKIEDDFNKLDSKTQNEIIKNSIEELNKRLNMLNSQLKIERDEDTGIQVVKIIDTETKEIIRQLPPDVILKIAKYIDEVTGLLFNDKA